MIINKTKVKIKIINKTKDKIKIDNIKIIEILNNINKNNTTINTEIDKITTKEDNIIM